MTETVKDGDDLLYEVREEVAIVTFNRPQARNALTFAMYERLAAICAMVDEDRSIRAMVLTGAGGKAFAAGTDISQFRSFDSAEDALAYEARMDRVLSALEQCRVPTIAAISGACTGGGAGIAGCCDLRIAAANAKFGLPIARTLGNCLSMSNYARFADLIGSARLKEMIFTARLVEAQEALAIGLVNEVVDDSAASLDRAVALARIVAGHAPLTLQASKQALRRLRPSIPRGAGDDLILMCYMSQDFREGMDAFLNKRAPNFTGR
jgi:enoyl-CoA hydratase